jgi:hypothetical protein
MTSRPDFSQKEAVPLPTTNKIYDWKTRERERECELPSSGPEEELPVAM